MRRFSELWKERAALIERDKHAHRTYESYPDYPNKETEECKRFCKNFNAQLALYRGRKGSVFGRNWVVEGAEEMPAYLWWDENGGATPELQMVARLVLAQPASASICERINSEFAFVKDRRRNQLRHERANKLVALFHNLRLMQRMQRSMYYEPAVAWTEEGEEKSGIIKWGLNNYERLQ